MRSLVFFLVFAGCSAEGGDEGGRPTTGDSAVSDAKEAGGEASIFPTDDAAVEDVATETSPTCGSPGQACCGTGCSSGYCHEGTCFANPQVIEEASNPEVCGDLGVTHTAPAFLARFTIHGRPNAAAYRYAKKISCASASPMVTPESPLTLDATGTKVFTIENTASTDCASGTLGKYEVWIVVDGVETTHHAVTYFNSACAIDCTAAATVCH